jgi:hypothetical protein
MDRIEETGRKSKGNFDVAALTEEYRLVDKLARESFPEETNLVDTLLGQVQFDVVRDIYRQINAASSGRRPKTEVSEIAPRSAHERVVRAKTNKISQQDFIYDSYRGKSVGDRPVHELMGYSARSNKVVVNITHPLIEDIKALEIEDLVNDVEERNARKKFLVYSFYHAVFHELGHAYGYVYSSRHEDAQNNIFDHMQVGVERIHAKLKPVPGEEWYEKSERTGMTFWKEGWNELATLFVVRDYLKSGHGLSFGGVRLSEEDFGEMFVRQSFRSMYGSAFLAIYSILDVISETEGLPFDTVFNSFVRVTQTKRGAEDLVEVLNKLLGKQLLERLVMASPSSEESDQLAQDIMIHIQAHPADLKLVEDIITHPSRRFPKESSY